MSAVLGFNGEVADYYHRYRYGYPPTVIDILVDAFGLTGDDLVVDLGCGTGQLAVPIAGRVRAGVGMAPGPDTPALAALLGGQRIGAVTIGQALDWMDYRTLMPTLAALLRPGGGIAVISNGTPMWLQDSAW